MEESSDIKNTDEPTLVGCEVAMKDPNGKSLKGVITKVIPNGDGTASLEIKLETGELFAMKGCYPMSYEPDVVSYRGLSVETDNITVEHGVTNSNDLHSWLQTVSEYNKVGKDE